MELKKIKSKFSAIQLQYKINEVSIGTGFSPFTKNKNSIGF
jgi:hypothetical protein